MEPTCVQPASQSLVDAAVVVEVVDTVVTVVDVVEVVVVVAAVHKTGFATCRYVRSGLEFVRQG